MAHSFKLNLVHGVVFLLCLILVSQFVLAHGKGTNEPANIIENIILLVHIITAVFMAWPLYALVTVNERPKVSALLGDKLDDFMEGIIKKNSVRCYVFQATALMTGLYLAWSHSDLGFSAILTKLPLLGKLIGLLILMGLLSYVVFLIQPRIDGLFEELKSTNSKENVSTQINQLRLKRKKIAATCLFTVLVILLLSIQIREQLPALANLVLIAIFALFVRRVFKANIPHGWI